ncbi:MAG: HD domain-containing protein [Thermoplasmatota archaeon]
MNRKDKFVRDPIHGNIKLPELIARFLQTPEIQRLYNIKQLGFAHLVFPGAHHTRLEHSLGSCFLASQIVNTLSIDNEKKDVITCAALLHDIGHGPFSHTLESLLLEQFGVDHIALTKELILGNYSILDEHEKNYISSPSVHELIATTSIDKNEIITIIKGKAYGNSYVSQILNSTIDVDQLDYLLRDAYYTGVSYGMIDIQRLLQTLIIYNDSLAIQRKGVSVVENILMARGLMYSSVYFHKTVRIAELMLSKAIEMIKDIAPFEFFRMTDAELVTSLQSMGRYQQEIITRLKYRNLFKQAYAASYNDLDESAQDEVKRLEDVSYRRKKEEEFEQIFDIPHGHLIIDVPRTELFMTEPRLHKTDIFVVDNNEKKTLDEYTTVAHAVRTRVTPDWAVMIISDEKYRDVISKKVREHLF